MGEKDVRSDLRGQQDQHSARVRLPPGQIPERKSDRHRYHQGHVAKEARGSEWRYLSIPPGGSAAYNKNPVGEKPPGAPQ